MNRIFKTTIGVGAMVFAGLLIFPVAAIAVAGAPVLWAAAGASEATDTQTTYPLSGDLPVWLEQEVRGSDAGVGKNQFGSAVALSCKTALIGADYADNYQGAVYAFAYYEGSWHETQKLTASGGKPSGSIEFGMAIACDGGTALIDAPYDDAVYVFTYSGNDGWHQTQRLTVEDGRVSNSFGKSLAIDGKTALIGDRTAPFPKGTVYVFTEAGGTWSLTQTLTAEDGVELFGGAVALDGKTALVTGNFLHNGDETQNAVYVFTESEGIWSLTQTLTASDGSAGPPLSTVALDGKTALVGAYDFRLFGGIGQPGAAYVFTKSGGSWHQTQKLMASDGGPGDLFGNSVALAGDTALIGADAITVNGNTQQGAAYLFTRSGGSWTQTQKFNTNDGAAYDYFGFSVALGKNTALIGAAGTNAAYFYGRSDLALALNAPEKIGRGRTFVSQTIATNSGSTISPAVIVTVAVPAAASFISATASQGDCNEAAGIVNCEFGQISGNAGMATANITLKAMGPVGAGIRNTVSIANVPPATPVVASETTAINVPPVADGETLRNGVGKTLNGKLKADDPDGDPLTFAIASQPQHGEVTLDNSADGNFTYTPAEGYAGADSFDFKANDGINDSNIATLTVIMSNQPPVASDGMLTTDENVAASGSLQAKDANSDPLVFRLADLPNHGSVTLDDPASGDYTYTPDAGFSGKDSFHFVASDGTQDSNLGTVSITVNRVAPPPPPDNGGNGGGGGFGGLLLALLAALAAATACLRNIGRRQFAALTKTIAFFSHVGAASAAIPPRPEFIATEGAPTKANARLDSGFRGHAGADETLNEHGVTKPMTRGLLSGALALLIAVGVSIAPFASIAWANPSAASAVHKPTGLTQTGIANARASEAPSPWVQMAPQSAVSLLKQKATRLGPHATGSTIELTIGLKLRNVAKLKRFLEAVQNPASPVYHQFLTPEKFTSEYGPSKADVARVVAFLKKNGITVKGVSPNRILIHTEAKTLSYESAFGIAINDYKLDGRSFYSTTAQPRLPRDIAPLVTNILGLNNAVLMRPMSRVKPLTAPASAKPHQIPVPVPATAYFNPYQIAKAYDWPDITDTDNGDGVTIAIITAAASGFADNNSPHLFWGGYELPDHTVNVIPVGEDEGQTGGMLETLLDIEWSGAMAPGATLDVYLSGNATLGSFTNMFNRLVNDNSAQVMSVSWGAAESSAPELYWTDEQIFMQAAAQGISMFAASGDWGAASCSPSYCGSGDNNAFYPSSSVYIASANGTELTISDVSGTYGNEHAWSDTGGAISQLFDQPAWQTGPGVPYSGHRMNSELSMNAGPLHPYLLYMGGRGWLGVIGTSAVAPQLAGLFAIGISQQSGGVSLGQSNILFYNDIKAGNYASDFRDVTTGCNGKLPDGSPSCAAANWDHPTGWGSPKGKSLLSHLGVHGPTGTLQGTITDAANGLPIVGAKVIANPGYVTRITDDDGNYSMQLDVGDYSIETTAFGYRAKTASITLDDGEKENGDYALTQASKVTLSGKVRDDSGHGYGLYARIKVIAHGFGTVATAWTDPKTGEYSLDLPKGADYTAIAAAAFDGYNTDSMEFTLSGDKTLEIPLTVTQACTAPGYAPTGIGEDFNGDFPPEGWKVENAATDSSIMWMLNSAWGFQNITGGAGTAADVGGNPSRLTEPFDTSLVTPPIAVAGLNSGALLKFKANYYSFQDALDVDISTDDGATWTTVLPGTRGAHGGRLSLPGVNMQVDLAPYLPATGSFRLRWHYYSEPNSFQFYYAQIDDVLLGACRPLKGGLVLGQVTDANSGEGLVGVKVSGDQGAEAETLVNPDDPNLSVGSYLLFAATGSQNLTAAEGRYTPATKQVAVHGNGIVVQDFTLDAGRLNANPNRLALHVRVNSSATASFALANSGSSKAHYELLATPLAPPPPVTVDVSVPRLTVPGDFSPTSLLGRKQSGKNPVAGQRRFRVGSVTPFNQEASAWKGIAPYPIPIVDNCAATSPITGKVYSIAGVTWGAMTPAGFVYDPGTGNWSPIADLPAAIGIERPACGFLNGKFYVTNGVTFATNGGFVHQVSNKMLYVYDPATDSWTTGAKNVHTTGVTTAGIAMDGKLYVIGGCGSSSCAGTDTVVAYDPASNRWSSLAPYPIPIAWQGCAAVSKKIYCAGGLTVGNAPTNHAYVYDPAADTWSAIADMPYDNWGMAASATFSGYFLLQDGVSAGAATNRGTRYSVASNSWSPLPNNIVATARGAGACGFYMIGGMNFADNLAGITDSEVLPGYSPCGKPPSVSWVTLAPAQGTLVMGKTATVALTIDGIGQKKFTTSNAYVYVTGNTPYDPTVVPISVTWDPQPVNLTLSGSASPSTIRKGDNLAYIVTVKNEQTDNHGAASDVALTYTLPEGVEYVSSSGDATCSAAGGIVTCDFGTLAQGAGKTETLTVTANTSGTLDGTFEVTSREPDSDPSGNTLTLNSQVVGTADLQLGATQGLTINEGGPGSLSLTLSNRGPDTAADVKLSATPGTFLAFRSADASQGSCSIVARKLKCDLGGVPAGAAVTITLNVFGIAAGAGQINVLATTTSDDDSSDNSAQIKVAVKASNSGNGGNDSGGGGALGWLALAALLTLVGATVGLRRKWPTMR